LNFETILFDSDILIEYFKGNQKVVAKFEADANRFEAINMSIISHFEVLKGFKILKAQKKLIIFKGFCQYRGKIFGIDAIITDKATDIYVQLEKKGMRIDIPDCLIAATALMNDLTVCTNNERHFNRIDGLKIINWLK